LTKEKVIREIFEDQFFCANVHHGNVKTGPSRPIIWAYANPKALTGLGHLGCMLAQVL
jgi:hypothetical protein